MLKGHLRTPFQIHSLGPEVDNCDMFCLIPPPENGRGIFPNTIEQVYGGLPGAIWRTYLYFLPSIKWRETT
jgi:hypothetical protein